jgi:hypothetical protein
LPFPFYLLPSYLEFSRVETRGLASATVNSPYSERLWKSSLATRHSLLITIRARGR